MIFKVLSNPNHSMIPLMKCLSLQCQKLLFPLHHPELQIDPSAESPNPCYPHKGSAALHKPHRDSKQQDIVPGEKFSNIRNKARTELKGTNEVKKRRIQGQARWGSKQPDLVEAVPAHCRGLD